MNKLTTQDYDLMYWHAISKMHQGAFVAAKHLFAYLFAKTPSFQVGLACAYCAYRDGDTAYAKTMLHTITPDDLTQTKLLNRLLKRVQA